MSIVFRLKYNLGLVSTADQLDTKWHKLVRMREDLNQMENSDELKKFEDLKRLVESSEFLQHKREIENLHYRGSNEERLVLEQKALAKSFDIRNYYQLNASEILARFEKIVAGADLKRYLDLQQQVESYEFKSRKVAVSKKEYRKSPDYQLETEFVHLKKNNDIRFWKKFSGSEKYQSYLKTAGSKELKGFEELSAQVVEPGFLVRVEYLKDRKRFEKSDEYKQILLYQELDKGRFMADYRKLKKEKVLDFFKKWEILLDENFHEKELNTEHWQPENWLGYKISGTSFSQEGEKQSFLGLRNIQINNNTLSLWARKEKVVGNVWNPAVGLIPKQHDYTSSIMNSAEFFRIREGIVEAKVRFKKDATIISAFSLTGEKPFPQVDLFRSNKSGVGMGIIEKHGGKSDKYLNLKGLKDELYHIYRLEIFGDQLTWRINGHEVYRNTMTVREPMFFNLLTTLHGEVNEQLLPHQFEVDWIRCFALKS